MFRYYGGKRYEAEITSEGEIQLQNDGSCFTSPSAAADYITKTSINGWTWWKYLDKDNNEHSIDELRVKL